ncbi:MAG: DUF5947 family protein [Actinomycetota bacterium]|nr:DUF5947 family protein [Actinomycetota bacterium]
MTSATPTGNPLEVIARVSRGRSTAPAGPRCEMCGEPITDAHQHVVNTEQRSLLCTCRPCYLLFTAERAALKYRAVPDRFLTFPDFRLGPGQWDDLEIPVNLVFVFQNASLDSISAFYPGPAGATESTLPLTSWARVVAENPALGTLQPDVEALLLRAPLHGGSSYECYLVPVDSCYELIGRLRQVWRGFDGGTQARQQIDNYFAEIRLRSRPAPDAATDAALPDVAMPR